MEIDHDWTIRPGAYGKGLKKHSRPEIWAELESTYVGSGTEENWDALFRTIGLFRCVATEVAAALGLEYPQEMDRKVTDRLQRIRSLGRSALSIR
jgi:aminoglycoside 6-adenylyltransferase